MFTAILKSQSSLCAHYNFLDNEADCNSNGDGTTTTIDVSINSDGHNSTSDKATAVGGAVGGIVVGMLLLVALVIFVTCIVKLKKSRKGSTSTEESSMSIKFIMC